MSMISIKMVPAPLAHTLEPCGKWPIVTYGVLVMRYDSLYAYDSIVMCMKYLH